MKTQFFTKLFIALTVALSPALSHAASSTDLTASGNVSLSRPAGITGRTEGVYKSNLKFNATVRETTGEFITGPTEVSGAKVKTLGRIGNKQIIENAVGAGNAKGYTLVLVHFGNLSTAAPVIGAYNAKTTDFKVVNASALNGLKVDLDWLDFVGVYKGSAVVSSTASGTASPTTIFLASGKLSGNTAYEATVVPVAGRPILMKGVGTFSQNSKGITGRANLTGSYVAAP